MATVNLSEATFSETVNGPGTVLVDFWAEWCGPCRAFAPVFHASSEKHPELVFGKVDTEAESGLAGALGIMSIPTLMVFREGILLFAEPGARPGAELEKLITAVQDLDMNDVRTQIAAASQKQA